jgi:hypothetical protein
VGLARASWRDWTRMPAPDPGDPMGVPDGLRATLADRHAFERELGRGGMAVVYLARDLS